MFQPAPFALTSKERRNKANDATIEMQTRTPGGRLAPKNKPEDTANEKPEPPVWWCMWRALISYDTIISMNA
jgi:hypothetical protein